MMIAVAYTFPFEMRQFCLFNAVIHIDATAKTNKEERPLVTVTGKEVGPALSPSYGCPPCAHGTLVVVGHTGFLMWERWGVLGGGCHPLPCIMLVLLLLVLLLSVTL